MNKKKENKTYTGNWTAIADPLYYVECPHCKATILMSTPSIIKRLKNWAKKLTQNK